MARVNFSPGRIEFFCKEWTKTVKDLHFGDCSKKYFPCFEKGKTFFLKIKKTFIQQSKSIKNFKLFSTT
jgi:hypothetical protein